VKKLLSLIFTLALAAGFAAAQDGIGLSAGLEFGIGDINMPKQGKLVTRMVFPPAGPPTSVQNPVPEARKPYLRANIGYENGFLDGTLDVYARLAYDVGFYKSAGNVAFYKSVGGVGYYNLAGGDSKEKNPQNLYLDLMVGYNLRLGDTSTLSFIVGNENSFMLSPQADGGIIGVVRPGIKFNQYGGNPGEFYAQADVPIAYKRLGQENKDRTFTGLDITLGWLSTFGLGVEATWHVLFAPNDKTLIYAYNRPAGMPPNVPWTPPSNIPDTNGFTGISFAVSYETGPIHAEVALTSPVKIHGVPYSWFDTTPDYGMVITPLFRYTFIPGLSAYASLTIDGIGARAEQNRKVGVGITPAIGVTYRF